MMMTLMYIDESPHRQRLSSASEVCCPAARYDLPCATGVVVSAKAERAGAATPTSVGLAQEHEGRRR